MIRWILVSFSFYFTLCLTAQVPSSQFTVSQQNALVGTSLSFTNQSILGGLKATKIKWDFGDGQASSNSNPTHIYLLPGVFQVSLNITTSGGTDSEIKAAYITIAPILNSGFSASDTSGCSNFSVQFTDKSYNPSNTDPIVSWNWDFGDGSSFNGQNPPVHNYGVGKYTVSLTIITQQGSSKFTSITNYIKVGKITSINYDISPNTIPITCAKRNYSFTDLSVLQGAHDSTEVHYIWNFGDGDTSSKQNPIYNFASDTGFMNIQLLVNYRGCKDSIIKNNLLYVKSPISNFTIQKLYCNPVNFPNTPLRVTVKDNSKVGRITDNVDMTWKWGVIGEADDFLSNVDIFDSNKGDSAHIYNAYGTYFVKQIIHNYTTGCSDSTTKTVTISKMEPSFTISNDTICLGSPINVISTSVYTDPAPFFSFNMGNTTVKNGNPINYIYPASGTFNITLKATNAAGCIKSVAITNIKVLNKPSASISIADTNVCINIPTLFSNYSSTPNLNVPLTSFLWTLPDGSHQITNLLSETVSFTPLVKGNFTTSVTATDAFGCVSNPKSIQLAIAQPKANFSIDSVVCDLENFTTNNTSNGDNPLIYNWKIDNTSNSNTPTISTSFDEISSPSYTYVSHLISLKTTDKHGCSDSISKTIKVSMPKAKIGYSASGATANLLGEFICPPVLETYTDNSISYGTVDAWNWTFGNFFTSTLKNPVNSYNFPGIFNTSLTITDQFGCTADTTLTNYLKILGPKADVNWTPSGNGCGHKYLFSATNLVTVDSLIWDLDDGTTTPDSTSFTHPYSTGSYQPNVTLIDSYQCKVTYPLSQIDILPSQLLANAGNDQTICQNSTSMAASASLLGKKVWHLINGSGIITDTTSPTTSITNLGSGLNTFVWTVKEGCEIVTDTVEIINAQLNVDAGSDKLICSTSYQLNATKPIVGNGNWSIHSGTGNFVNSTNPQSIINGLSIGLNEFIWTITNQCVTISDTIKIVVETNPTIPNAGNDQSICESNYQLNGNPALIGTSNWTNIVGSGTISNPTIENPNITNLSKGQNIFQWKISNTCSSDSSRVIITLLELPTAAKTEKVEPICGKQVLIKGNLANIGTGTWTKVSGQGTITNPNNYITNVTNIGLGFSIYRWTISNSCGSDSSDVIVRSDTIPSDAFVGKDQTFCGYDYILAGNKPVYGKGHWSLLSGYCLIFDSTDNTSGVSNINIGTTELKWSVTNSCGTKSASYKLISTGNCPDEDSLANKLVYFIPNTFTPNGDKLNATFTPVFSSGIDPLDFWMLIYDRWGNVIFETHDPNRGWNGTLGENGAIVAEGIYNWKIYFNEIISKEKRKITGDVLIIK